MLSTFDRYLIRRFLHVFAIYFASTMGLFVIIDAFTHADEFQIRGGVNSSFLSMLSRMGMHYLYQTSLFFDLIAPFLAIVSVMTVLTILLRYGELNPILAAGVPTYRLIVPFVLGILSINALLAVNQELIIPRIAEDLQMGHGKSETTGQSVQPCYDNHLVHFAGKNLFMKDREVESPHLTLPFPAISENPTTLTATSATYHKAFGQRPAGWLLKNPKPTFEQIPLTETGKRLFRSLPSGELFFITDLTLDQISNVKNSYRYLSTQALISRIRHPSVASVSRNSQILNFHGRITQPIFNLIGLCLVIPLILRKESWSSVMNLTICTLVLIAIYGLGEGARALSKVNMLDPELATWLPVISGGGLATWLSAWTRT